MKHTYVALDLETTGLDPDRDAIIEIGVVKFKGNRVLETWSSLVNPKRPLPYRVQRLTGIAQEEVDAAPPLRLLLPKLKRLVGDSVIIGHSIDVDLAFLNRHGLFLLNEAIDTFELAGIFVPYAARYSLEKLVEALGLERSPHHRALGDAIAAMRLYLALLERAAELPRETLEELIGLAERSGWPVKAFFVEALHRKARTSLAPNLGQQLKAKGILGQGPLSVLMQEEGKPLRPIAEKKPLDVEELTGMLEEGGLFSQRFPGYEYRPQQREMLQAIARAFNKGEHLLVEAGTGVGKSLAYLLPSVYFSVQNGERVIISTNTINLQDQLYRKDIPDLRRTLPLEFRAAVLKGRSNYLCMRKLSLMRRRSELSLDEARLLAKILVWLESTISGDVAELFIPSPAERAAWNEVASDPESCLAERCPYFREKRCFFYAARQAAERAHIVLINHALLLSDIAMENKVLPEYRYLIVDEAHHLEDVATEQLGFSVDRGQLERLLIWLGQDEKGGDLLGQLLGQAGRLVSRSLRLRMEDFVGEKRRQIREVRFQLAAFFRTLEEFISAHTGIHKGFAGEYDRRIRITQALRTQPGWLEVEVAWEELSNALSRLLDELMRFREELSSLLEMSDDPYLDGLVQELGGVLHHIVEWQAQVEVILVNPSPQGIYWFTLKPKGGHLSLNAAPLNVAPLLERHLFNAKESVILTSATLRTGNSFDYIRERLGAWEARELALGSPFDYASSTLLYLPTDMPEPDTPGYQKAVESTLVNLCKALEGRTLVLFTSYRQLRRTAKAIIPPLAEEGILVLEQGDGSSRTQLLETFRTSPKAVLLGTRSFWEGIDVAGEALSCVVITRLPFSVPTDPIFAARSETYDDPFHQYAVPEGILRLRQGFGRLIRSKTDRGVVVILDKRVQTRAYGRAFLQSLPPCTVVRGPLDLLPSEAEMWIKHRTVAHKELVIS